MNNTEYVATLVLRGVRRELRLIRSLDQADCKLRAIVRSLEKSCALRDLCNASWTFCIQLGDYLERLEQLRVRLRSESQFLDQSVHLESEADE